MDLVHVDAVIRARGDGDIPAFMPGDAFVSGGTWLFSDPQPQVRRLVDLSQLRWVPITIDRDSVEIAANCTYQQLEAFDWSELPAAALFPRAIRALSSSFKTYPLATVGGNICLAFAKCLMPPVFITLDASYQLCQPGGEVREVPAASFQTGVCQTILQPGEYLRRISVPRAAFARRVALKSAAFTRTSSVIAVAVAALEPDSRAASLTLSAAFQYPVKVPLEDRSAAGIDAAIDAACAVHPSMSDPHGSAAYRQALLRELAREAVKEVEHGA